MTSPQLVAGWVAEKGTRSTAPPRRPRSSSSSSWSLRSSSRPGGTQSYATQLLWKFNPNTVVERSSTTTGRRLVEHPLVSAAHSREPVSTKGTLQTVDLSNVKTFVPAYDRDRGSFVGVYREDK